MKKQTKEYAVFILLAYILPLFLSLLFMYGKKRGLDTSILAQFQMLTPALGATVSLFLTKNSTLAYPRIPFALYIGGSLVYLILSILMIRFPHGAILTIHGIFLPIWSLVFVITCYKTSRVSQRAYKLDLPSIKSTLKVLGLFLVLYFLRALVATSLDQGLKTFLDYFTLEKIIYFGLLLVNLPFALVFFFGEEYGWRAFLQPKLQEKFGQVPGILLLGLCWAIWHLPLNLFYYSSQGTGLLSLVNQVFVCLAYAIFLAFAYGYTKSVWAPVLIHYFNNNLILFFTENLDPHVIEGQVFTWEMVLINGALMLIFFAPFILSKYTKKEAFRPPTLPKSSAVPFIYPLSQESDLDFR